MYLYVYLETTLTNENIICDLTSRLNLGNARYHVVQNILSLHVLFESIQTKM